MSSILKALRRLEEERARKSHAAPEIAASLLRRGARRRSTPPWIWPAVIIAVAVVAAGLLWVWRPLLVANQIVTPVAPPASISVTAAANRGGEVIIEEVIDQRRPVLLPSSLPPDSAQKPLPAKINPPQQKVKSEVLTPSEAIKPVAAFIEERHSPVVSAIAWQEDSTARMAVVDGLPVMTGEFVGSARVQEILRDRILFTEAGILFTVYIDPQ